MPNEADDDQPTSKSSASITSASSTATVFRPGEVGSNGQKQNKQPISVGSTSDMPGRRVYNPLSRLSSYTYHITLYLVDPDAMNAFSISGGQGIRRVGGESSQIPGFYIIAQSGGINSRSELRALTLSGTPGKGDGLDFYIDDLSFTAVTIGGGGASPSQTMNFEFKIYEPYGFNFIQKLNDACAYINQRSSKGKANDLKNSGQFHYMIGIKFYGYGPAGEVITSNFFNDGSIPSIDGATDGSAVFERYYPIKLTKMDFRIDGKMVVYHCGAEGMAFQEAFSHRGTITESIEVVGSTVEEVLLGESIGGDTAAEFFVDSGSASQRENPTGNNQQSANNAQPNNPKTGAIKGLLPLVMAQYEDQKLKNIRGIAPKLYAQFERGEYGNAIRNSKVTSEDPTASVANKGSQSTAQQSNTAKSATSNGVRYSIKAGTPIIQAIDDIISSSTYVTDTLKQIASADPEASLQSSQSTRKTRWYLTTPVVKIVGTDEKLNDWAYDICYQIQSYSIPFLRNPYVENTDRYMGPVKKYQYWYTGKNTEIIEFSQEFNWLFVNLKTDVPGGIEADAGSKSKYIGPMVPVGSTPARSTGIGTNRENIINQNVKASLYSPSEQAVAKIKIIGDPDLLFQTILSQSSLQRDYSRFYSIADGYSINLNAGQVFIEIAFNNATDYDPETGQMIVSDQVQFYPIDTANRLRKEGVQGIVYKIISCQSTFSDGKFEQVLELIQAQEDVLNPEGQGNNNGRQSTGGQPTATQSVSGQAPNGQRTASNNNSNKIRGTVKALPNQTSAETNRLNAAAARIAANPYQSADDDANPSPNISDIIAP